jgi:hypothetical protein
MRMIMSKGGRPGQKDTQIEFIKAHNHVEFIITTPSAKQALKNLTVI